MNSTDSLLDLSGGVPLVSAVRWLEGLILGPLATTIAVIALAGFGALMLQGRIDMRRGASIVLGCFIVFGAVVIAGGLRELAGGDVHGVAAAAKQTAMQPPNGPPSPDQSPAVVDPYAGASLPTRR